MKVITTGYPPLEETPPFGCRRCCGRQTHFCIIYTLLSGAELFGGAPSEQSAGAPSGPEIPFEIWIRSPHTLKRQGEKQTCFQGGSNDNMFPYVPILPKQQHINVVLFLKFCISLLASTIIMFNGWIKHDQTQHGRIMLYVFLYQMSWSPLH